MRPNHLSPSKVLVLSFIIVIFSGTLLLLLPFSRTKELSFIDTLFTAASATCVTGLTVVDVGKTFTLFGQFVILLCIQIGGLGLMLFSSLIAILMGKGLSFKDRTLVIDTFLPFPVKGISNIVKQIILYTFVIEFGGACLLFVSFSKRFQFWESMKLSVFHSVSAFCNAGFSLFSDNLVSYRGDPIVNLTVIFLIFFGGIGFFSLKVITGFIMANFKKKRFKIPLHFKIVFITSIFLVITGAILFYVLERNDALERLSFKEKILSSLFQAVTPRTAGFNTIDTSIISSGTTLLLMILMFIGASPGSTGGGIKTSTFYIILAYIRGRLKGERSIFAFSRNVPLEIASKAFVIFFLSAGLVIISSFLILALQDDITFDRIVFEVTSAFGTVGLSKGITPFLNSLSKIIIIMTMFAGRVGTVTLVYTLREPKEFEGITYPEERVMVG